MRVAIALLACVAASGCSSKLIDPCARETGTCVTLYIDSSPFPVAAIDVHITTDKHASYNASSSESAAHAPPIAVALTFEDTVFSDSSSALTFDVTGTNGPNKASGMNTATVTKGAHTAVHVHLVNGTNDLNSDGKSSADLATRDGATIDQANEDLNATDFAGDDLQIDDLSIDDLNADDLAGEDLSPVDLPLSDLPDLVAPPPADMFAQECQINNDCKDSAKPYCENFKCVQCRLIGSPNDCIAGRTCCSNVCSTLQDINNCGGCGKACASAGVGTQTAVPSCSAGTCYLHCGNGFEDCDSNAANGCETNLGTNTSNCGACGHACSSTNVAAESCSSGKCASTCSSAVFGNCSMPTAPTADDGCEKTLNNDPSNCGGCGVQCSTATTDHSGRICSGTTAGTCTYTCKSGKFDCDVGTAPNTDGCECDGDASGESVGGVAGCCNGGCQTRHNTGISSPANYFDCVPTGTYNEAQAQEACTASTGVNCTEEMTCFDGSTVDTLCGHPFGNSSMPCVCWVFGGPVAYQGLITYRSTGVLSACDCANASPQHTATWN